MTKTNYFVFSSHGKGVWWRWFHPPQQIGSPFPPFLLSSCSQRALLSVFLLPNPLSVFSWCHSLFSSPFVALFRSLNFPPGSIFPLDPRDPNRGENGESRGGETDRNGICSVSKLQRALLFPLGRKCSWNFRKHARRINSPPNKPRYSHHLRIKGTGGELEESCFGIRITYRNKILSLILFPPPSSPFYDVAISIREREGDDRDQPIYDSF